MVGCGWLVPQGQGRLGIFPCNVGLQFTESHQQKSPRNLLTDVWIDGKTSNDQFWIQKPQFRRRSNGKPQAFDDFVTFSLLYPFIYLQVPFLRNPVKSTSMRPCEEAMLSNTFYISLFKPISVYIYMAPWSNCITTCRTPASTTRYISCCRQHQTTLQRSEASSS